MRFGKAGLAAAAFSLAGAAAFGGVLEQWVQHLSAGPTLAVFFRSVPMPGGNVQIRRSPAETRPALAGLIAAKPRVASLYRMRAHEDEAALDFPAAEADWRKFAGMSANRAEGYTALADYFHRREEPLKEVEALGVVEKCKTNPITPLTEQLPWKAVERTQTVASEEALPDSVPSAAYGSWLQLHPSDVFGYQRAFDFYSRIKAYDQAQSTLDAYAKEFPGDRNFFLTHRADLEAARGSVDQAIAVYDSAFDPLWPTDLAGAYFNLLGREDRKRDFLAKARQILQNEPTSLNATARVFDYFQNEKNQNEAKRALLNFRLAKETARQAYTPEELWTLGQLFERINEPNEAAKSYYALYSAPGASNQSAEQALGSLANLLLTQGDQPIAFGSGDLSFYRDVGQVDRSPGFLNGILSLVFNSASPVREYDQQNPQSAGYFRRSAGEKLAGLLEQRFPKSERLPGLKAAIVQDCAAYVDNQCLVRVGREYLAAYPKEDARIAVAMALADAFAREKQFDQELGLYGQLLKELGAAAQGVPIGAQTDGTNPTARSPQYQQVLDRYLARLSELKRPMDALRVYRGEIVRNPNDPGLYREFAAYLDQNRLGTQLIETYRRAMAKFPNGNWYQSLARWYLQRKRTADFERLTREVTETFSGTNLEGYFREVVATAKIDASMYLALNRYAHQRFPEDIAFVRNLLGAYGRTETRDPQAEAELLRGYWFYDDDLKRRFFANRSREGQLERELASVSGTNPAEVQFLAEGDAWLSHFEEAAPQFRKMAETKPGDTGESLRAASIYRSLAAYDAQNTEIAVQFQRQAVGSDPRNRDWLESVGDIYADREELDRARPVWNAVLKIEPGKTDSYLSAATVFWDYYLFGDALRVIGDGRRRFKDPTLFAYEAGAIAEGRRDPTEAVGQYVAGAVAGDSRAEQRLIRLAKRKSYAPLVDRATAALGTKPAAARNLRIAILEATDRRDALETFLGTVLREATTGPEAAEAAEVARRDGFDAIEEQATEKQVAATADPVEHMRLEIDLARFFEAHHKPDRARRTMEALYRRNPKILGVVRARVEFEKRMHNPDGAIATLLEAAKSARPELADQFTLEAANTATEAGQFDRSRALLAGLLKSDPLNAGYLAAEADTYARGKDDAGYRRFVLATIQQLQGSPLAAGEKVNRIAALRRGLIPVLTGQQEFAQAVDQYIEVVNRYPEDEGLAREAAGYALQHNRLDQLAGFYRKTVQASPRDYRWPIVLARIETRAEDYPAAIAAYDRAMTDRPDKVDVAQARGVLEERVLRFDDALRTYGKVYQLTYHDPGVMHKMAELQARLGHKDAAVKALRAAVMGDNQETPEMLFEMADQLNRWNMTPEAAAIAEQAAKLSGRELFATDPPDPNLAIYAAVMARARHMDRLLARMDPEQSTGVKAAAGVIAAEYSAEEKAGLAAALARLPNKAVNWPGEVEWLSLAQQAGMAPLEARILGEQLRSAGRAESTIGNLYKLQLERGEFEAVGRELEQFAQTLPQPGARVEADGDAAAAFVTVNDEASAMPILDRMARLQELNGPLQAWYLGKLARSNPDRLVALAGDRANVLRDVAAQYAIANGDVNLALRAVTARGASETPLWNRAFTALTGLYFADPEASIRSAFAAVLGSDADIGTRVKTAVNRTQQLTGTVWFYYGARYGVYLDRMRRSEAAEYLPAWVEVAPGDPEAYVRLGSFYEDRGMKVGAIAAFRNLLQLSPDRGDAHDRIARVLWSEGKKSEAVAEWRAAIATYERLQSRGVAVPETFWVQGEETIRDIGKSGALDSVEPDLERWIRDYAQRNGDYRLLTLLSAAFETAVDVKADFGWVLDIAEESASDQTFAALLESERLTPAQRAVLQRRRLAVFEARLAAAHGDERNTAEHAVAGERVALVRMLVDAGDVSGAGGEWSRLSRDEQRMYPADEIELAAALGTVPALLKSYRENPDTAPDANVLQTAVLAIRKKHPQEALAISEFLYQRELDAQHLEPANFLGLAEVYLQRGEAPKAAPLLRRMNLVAGEPFETFVAAADLLTKHGQPQEAIPFLRDRLRATPWDAEARLKLGKLLAGAERTAVLNEVVADTHANYGWRVEAAKALSPGGAASAPAGSELAILSAGAIDPTAAEKPYQAAARVVAAGRANGVVWLRLLRGAMAIEPKDVAIRKEAERAALENKNDHLALAMAQTGMTQTPSGPTMVAEQPGPEEPAEAAEKADAAEIALAEQLSLAAERVDDLAQAIQYEQAAAQLRHGDEPLKASPRLKMLQAEQARRVENAARQPVIASSVEPRNDVRPKVLKAAVMP